MKSFRSLREFYQVSGVLPPQPNQKCMLNAKNVLFLTGMLQYVVWGTPFLLFKPASVTDYGKAIYGITSMLVFSLNFLITINSSADIFKLIDKFENFMERSKSFSFPKRTILRFYKRLSFIPKNDRTIGVRIRIKLQRIKRKNRKILSFNLQLHNKMDHSWHDATRRSHNRSRIFRLWWKIILRPQSNDVRSEQTWGSAEIEPKIHVLLLLSRLPFDENTAFGYLVANLLLSAVVYTFSFCAAQIVCFLIGSCLVLVALVEGISNDLKLLDVSSAAKNARETCQVEQRVHFCKIVQHYADIKELSTKLRQSITWFKIRKVSWLTILSTFVLFLARLTSDFNGIYEYIITGTLLWSLSTICSSLLVVLSELVRLVVLILLWISIFHFKFLPISPNLVKTGCGSIWNGYDILARFLVICNNVLILWVRRKGDEWIRWILWQTLPIELVWMATWFTTDADNCYDRCTEASKYTGIRKHCLLTRAIQSGKCSLFACT